MLEKKELIILVSLIITVFVVIFVALLAMAGNIQTMFSGFLGLILFDPPPKGILNFMLASMFVPMLGPPLSWGASVLGLFNSNWWMNSYMSWYLGFVLGIINPI
ncbi:MAG: hypothetical protein ACUVXA_01880 [Candidatus Jordarchaeum sp.]|uniref:hypothetical protein n=1 Tax=Candidatus Jordarchaeum sp. TaxID=2823881 RepID=UPI0040493A5A